MGKDFDMRELDFLFVYEHKVRELENLCLIKCEAVYSRESPAGDGMLRQQCAGVADQELCQI